MHPQKNSAQSAGGGNRKVVPIGITDSAGNPYFRGTPSSSNDNRGGEEIDGGGGGAMKFTLPDLRWNVAILNGLATIFATALVAGYFILDDRIGDRFDTLDNRNHEISETLGDIRAENATQSAYLQQLLEERRNIDQSERSPQNGQD